MRASFFILFQLTLFVSTGACSRRELERRALSPEVERACDQSAASVCDRVATCSTPLFRHTFGDRDECLRDLRESCRERFGGPLSSPAPLPCDGAAISCEDVKGRLALGDRRFLELCPLQGGAAEGDDPCLHDADCASGTCERTYERSAACGRCGADRREGAPCPKSRSCAGSLVCSQGLCSKAAPVGASCVEVSCAGDDVSTKCRSGVCVANPARGEPCEGLCDLGLGLVCDARTSTCQELGFARVGEPCDFDDIPSSLSDATLRTCEGSARCKGGRCVEAGPLDAPCSAYDDCRRPLSCVDGRCRVQRLAPPERCTVDD